MAWGSTTAFLDTGTAQTGISEGRVWCWLALDQIGGAGDNFMGNEGIFTNLWTHAPPGYDPAQVAPFTEAHAFTPIGMAADVAAGTHTIYLRCDANSDNVTTGTSVPVTFGEWHGGILSTTGGANFVMATATAPTTP